MRELTIYRSDGYGGNEHVELDIDVIRRLVFKVFIVCLFSWRYNSLVVFSTAP